jgi:hypothetical protein
MTAKEFRAALELANDHEYWRNRTCLELAYNAGENIRTHETPVVSTKSMAALIRYQALQFNGEWDNMALSEVKDFARRAIIVM